MRKWKKYILLVKKNPSINHNLTSLLQQQILRPWLITNVANRSSFYWPKLLKDTLTHFNFRIKIQERYSESKWWSDITKLPRNWAFLGAIFKHIPVRIFSSLSAWLITVMKRLKCIKQVAMLRWACMISAVGEGIFLTRSTVKMYVIFMTIFYDDKQYQSQNTVQRVTTQTLYFFPVYWAKYLLNPNVLGVLM